MVGLNFSRNMEVCLRNKDTAEMQDERKRKEIESINKGKRAVLCHLAGVASKDSPNLRHLSGIITPFGRGCRAYLLSSDVDEKAPRACPRSTCLDNQETKTWRSTRVVTKDPETPVFLLLLVT